MYSISIYDTKQSRRRELEKLLVCYFSAKGLPFRIRSFSAISDILRTAGYTDIALVSVDERDSAVLDMCDTLLRNNAGIYLYILSEKYCFLDEAMDLKAFRYLEQPVDIGRLFASLDIIINKPINISFTSDHMRVTLSEDEIVCIYTSGRKTYVLTDAGTVYPTTLTLKEWLNRTAKCENFACPHYGYIVNMKYIKSFSGDIVTLRCKTGKALTVYPSQRKMAEFKDKYYSRN